MRSWVCCRFGADIALNAASLWTIHSEIDSIPDRPDLGNYVGNLTGE